MKTNSDLERNLAQELGVGHGREYHMGEEEAEREVLYVAYRRHVSTTTMARVNAVLPVYCCSGLPLVRKPRIKDT